MYQYTQSSNSFPMLFSHRGFDEGELYSFSTSPSASVDCTLSLGTPSTRAESNSHHHDKKRSSCIWKNILQPLSSSKPHRSSGGDPLLDRRCANCDATSTPLWRNGPRGPKSLCNACGIRYKKEERKATAAAAAGNGNGAEAQYMMNGSWAPAATQKTACYPSAYGSEYRFMEDDVVSDHRDSEMGGGVPFMSWRFNVTDRPSLVPDFTR